MSTICSVCNSQFADLDTPLKCDSCSQPVHNRCSGLSTTELKCFSLKNRSLKYFCLACDQGLKDLPDIKMLIKKLILEVEELKKSPPQVSNIACDNEFIINEISDRNSRATNIICYNICESDSNLSDVRISHDRNQVNSILQTIFTDTGTVIPVPLKVIRLGRYLSNKPRPLKVVFNSISESFDVIRNKKKLSTQYPLISLGSDRTQYQRNLMKKLREELSTRISSGEQGLTIKFVKNVPKIVKLSEKSDNNSQLNF